MAKRKIRNEADARQCLAAVEASGLERIHWARREGIDGRSLRAWQKKLSRSIMMDQRPRMVELMMPLQPARYVVRCGQMEVEIDNGFESETLLRLLRVISAC